MLQIVYHKLVSFLVLFTAVFARASHISLRRLELFFLLSSLLLLAVALLLPWLPWTFSASFTNTFNLHNVYSLCIQRVKLVKMTHLENYEYGINKILRYRIRLVRNGQNDDYTKYLSINVEIHFLGSWLEAWVILSYYFQCLAEILVRQSTNGSSELSFLLSRHSPK